jgi:hypothetical protein
MDGLCKKTFKNNLVAIQKWVNLIKGIKCSKLYLSKTSFIYYCR